MLSIIGSPLPDIRGNGRLIWSVAVDTVGVGLFLPLSFYFFTVSTSLSVSTIGVTISAATLSALLVSPVGGLLTDRFGAKPMVVISNLATCAGYLCYPLVHSAGAVYGSVLVVMLADRLYYASWPTLISRVARPDELDGWFALVQAVGAGSLGLGSLVSTFFLLHGGLGTLQAIAVVNAATSLVAAALTGTLRPRWGAADQAPIPGAIPGALPQPTTGPAPAAAPTPDGPSAASGPAVTILPVLRDRAFRRLVGAQLLMCTAFAVPAVFLPLYLVRTLHLGQWMATYAYALNYLVLFAAQLTLTHRLRGLRRTRVLMAGGACFLGSLIVTGLAATASAAFGAAALVTVGVLIYTGGEMMLGPTAGALAAAMSPPKLRGVYMSMFQNAGAVAFGVGPALVGWLFPVSPIAILVIIGGCVAAGAALVLTTEPLIAPEALRRAQAPAARPLRAEEGVR